MPNSQPPISRRQQTLDILNRMRSLERGSRDTLEKVAAAKLLRLLAHTNLSAWWREYLGKQSGPASAESASEILARLPILSRARLQENIDWMRIWLPDSNRNQYSEIATSGSTGKPVRVTHFLPRYQPTYSANELLDVQWSGRDLNKNIGYFRITEPKTLLSPMPEPLSYLGGSGSIVYRNVLNLTPRRMLEELASENVAYLSVNAMVQRLLAIEQLERPVKGLVLEQLLNWADPVSPELRELVSKAFGARIVDRYTSNEFGYLALQCPEHDHLHAPQIQNYIEILDEGNRPVGPGELGRVVVTALDNYSQPLIRYELGDMARWGEPCPAGITFPVIEPGIVRQRELRRAADGRILVPHPDILEPIKTGAIVRYQVLEFSDLLVLLAEFGKPITESEREEAEERLAAQFGDLIPAKIVELTSDQASALSTWKNKRVLSFEHAAPEGLNPDHLLKLVLQFRPLSTA